MSTNARKGPSIPRHFRGVRGVWTGRTYKFRAVADVRGERMVGPLRTDVAVAHQDYLALCARRSASSTRPTSIGEALDRVLLLKRQGGQAAAPWMRAVTRIAGQIREAWDADTPISALDGDEITWFVGAMRERGMATNTIALKVVPLLRAAFRAAGVMWPETGVPRLRAVATRMSVFTFAEYAELRRRIEAEPRTDGVASPAHRQRFLDVLDLMVFTGARRWEVVRLRTGDIDPTNRVIVLTNNKARGRRDAVHYPAALDAAIARLLAGAEDEVLVPRCDRWLNNCFGRWKRLLDEPRLNGRTLRHTFVSAVLETSRDLAVTRDAARHASLVMTNRYVHASSEKKRAVVDELALRLASPRSQGS